MFLTDIVRFQSLDIAFIYFLFHRNRIFSYISSKIFIKNHKIKGRGRGPNILLERPTLQSCRFWKLLVVGEEEEDWDF